MSTPSTNSSPAYQHPPARTASKQARVRSDDTRAEVAIICEARQGLRPWSRVRLDDLSPRGFRIAWFKGADRTQVLRIRIPGLQMLAAHGYAVLQVNFRGSGNHGHAFQEAGRRQWGGTMQDDLTDATQWAIRQGIADPKRICIYGASYGGYASLMAPVRSPGTFKCAIGYLGVYDLNMLHSEGDTNDTKQGRNIVTQFVGEEAGELDANSPAKNGAKVGIPVLLVAGKEDVRAPMAHTNAMADALKKAGVPVFAYGSFITITVNFIILAFIIFMMIKQVNRLRAAEPVAPEPEPVTPEDIVLLREIRDSLKK